MPWVKVRTQKAGSAGIWKTSCTCVFNPASPLRTVRKQWRPHCSEQPSPGAGNLLRFTKVKKVSVSPALAPRLLYVVPTLLTATRNPAVNFFRILPPKPSSWNPAPQTSMLENKVLRLSAETLSSFWLQRSREPRCTLSQVLFSKVHLTHSRSYKLVRKKPFSSSHVLHLNKYTSSSPKPSIWMCLSCPM